MDSHRMKNKLKLIVGGLVFAVGLLGCSKEHVDFALKGTWVDTASPSLQFIEFTSTSQGRFGFLAKGAETYVIFSYRLVDTHIGIDVIGDNAGETLHDFKLVSANDIEISGLIDLPGDPTKMLRKSGIKRELENHEVILGIHDIYFDKENGLRLQGKCTNDSRCPENAVCFWQGAALASFSLVIDGTDEHEFELATIDYESFGLKNDTIIGGFTYRLLGADHWPKGGGEQKLEDYKLRVSIEQK